MQFDLHSRHRKELMDKVTYDDVMQGITASVKPLKDGKVELTFEFYTANSKDPHREGLKISILTSDYVVQALAKGLKNDKAQTKEG